MSTAMATASRFGMRDARSDRDPGSDRFDPDVECDWGSDPGSRIPDPGLIAHVRGSREARSARWARSVVIVGSPAASARSHGPDISRAVGQRRLIDTSHAVMWSVNSCASARYPAIV